MDVRPAQVPASPSCSTAPASPAPTAPAQRHVGHVDPPGRAGPAARRAARRRSRSREQLREAVDVDDAPTVVRFPKGAGRRPGRRPCARLGGVDVLAEPGTDGDVDLLLVGVGSMAATCAGGRRAARRPRASASRVVDPRWVNAGQRRPRRRSPAQPRRVAVVEDNGVVGGVGSAVDAGPARRRASTTPVRPARHPEGVPRPRLARQVLERVGLTPDAVAGRLRAPAGLSRPYVRLVGPATATVRLWTTPVRCQWTFVRLVHGRGTSHSTSGWRGSRPAREACRGIEGELWRAGSAELEQVMGAVDAMVVAGEAARVVVTAEAMSRGETGSGAEALSPVEWVRRHAPSTGGGWGGAGGGGGAGVRGGRERAGQGCRAVGGVAGAQCRGGGVRGRQAVAVGGRGGAADGVGGVDPDRGGGRAAGVPQAAPGAAGEVRRGRAAAARAGRARSGSWRCRSRSWTRWVWPSTG